MSDNPVGWLTPPAPWDPRRPISPMNEHRATPIPVYQNPDGTLRLTPAKQNRSE